MKEFLNDTEKRMLFCALDRELKFLQSTNDYQDLEKVVVGLMDKFRYDKIFKNIVKEDNSCIGCKYQHIASWEMPCKKCTKNPNNQNWYRKGDE